MAGDLWTIVETYRDSQSYPPSVRAIAKRLGISNMTLVNWRDRLTHLPRPENLHALAELTGVPYRDVLDAALRDAGYLD